MTGANHAAAAGRHFGFRLVCESSIPPGAPDALVPATRSCQPRAHARQPG